MWVHAFQYFLKYDYTEKGILKIWLSTSVSFFNCNFLDYNFPPNLWLILDLKQTRCNSTESCEGRCGSFNPRTKCQCDSMCTYYESCCVDFYTICPKKSECSSALMIRVTVPAGTTAFTTACPQLPAATPSARRTTFQRRRRLLRRQLLHRLSARSQQRPPPLSSPPPARSPPLCPSTPTQPPAAAVRLTPSCSWRTRPSTRSEVSVGRASPGGR